MRNMSFAKTTLQIREETKTVTRRMGWKFLKVGEVVQAVEKCQGLKKGEKIQPLDKILIESVTFEPLNSITLEDVKAEGFPEMTPKEFIDFFCEFNKCTPETEVTRIQFRFAEYRCEKCSFPLFHFEPEICCSGFECGCLGKPTEPALCSDCWGEIL